MTRCAWPGCSQFSHGEPLCYWHTKLATGLADGRDHLPIGRTFARQQELLLHNLQEVGAPDEVIEKNQQPPDMARASNAGGYFLPEGRLHLPGFRI
jgi:hypothetical protein